VGTKHCKVKAARRGVWACATMTLARRTAATTRVRLMVLLL
jgi:hypothetical protein